jgi:hypothetical protein
MSECVCMLINYIRLFHLILFCFFFQQMIPKKSDLNETNKNVFKNLLNFLRQSKSKRKRKKHREEYEHKMKESSSGQNFIKILVLGPGN